jgi:SAM-dependent methyltransferase
MKVSSGALLLVAFAAGSAFAHDTGRICSNPYCVMCMGLHLRSGHGIDTSSVSDWYGLHNRLHAELQAEANLMIPSTPQFVVEAILKVLKPRTDEVLFDIGCGDGRVVITAAKVYGCRAVGIEIDPEVAKIAKRRVKEAGVEKLVKIVVGDATKMSLKNADIVYMYLFPDVMRAMAGELKTVKRIASYSHKIPTLPDRKWILRRGGREYPFYVWEKVSNKLF